tara:strand:- start:1798 stop:2331 length:534 start_codon:yes stop_codon:yes gene_type:complete
MVTGDAVATSNSVYIRPILEDGLSKLLSSLDCKNIYTIDLPPVTTEQEFANRLQVHRGLAQPEYEAWFATRRSAATSPSAITNQYQYNQVHGMMISGVAYHGSFHDSYRYIQDKTDELMWTLEKNKDILGDSTIQYITDVSTAFVFEQMGEMYLYRSNTTFDVHRTVIETSGRSFTG